MLLTARPSHRYTDKGVGTNSFLLSWSLLSLTQSTMTMMTRMRQQTLAMTTPAMRPPSTASSDIVLPNLMSPATLRSPLLLTVSLLYLPFCGGRGGEEAAREVMRKEGRGDISPRTNNNNAPRPQGSRWHPRRSRCCGKEGGVTEEGIEGDDHHIRIRFRVAGALISRPSNGAPNDEVRVRCTIASVRLQT